jgi:hypothetical protein
MEPLMSRIGMHDLLIAVQRANMLAKVHASTPTEIVRCSGYVSSPVFSALLAC